MIPKKFEDITFADIQALKDNEVAEDKSLEYKREFPTTEKLLAGISALANTIGGDFIIGIEEKGGIPTDLKGVTIASDDAEKQRIENILLSGIEPRLPPVNIAIITSQAGGKFVVIRVKQSWIAPHRVKSSHKFYGRHSSGKYQMDVSELRNAFVLTEQISERIKNFRTDRVKKIKESDELPAELIEGSKMILHIMPLSAFSRLSQIYLPNIKEIGENLDVMVGNMYTNRINLDGIAIYSKSYNSEKSEAYTQLFRNGCLEAVGILYSFQRNEILSQDFEKTVTRLVKKYFEIISLFNSNLEIEPPIYIFLSFVNVKNFKLKVSGVEDRRISLDRQDIILPELIIDDYKEISQETLKPVFDMVWNAFGYGRCFDFDKNGNWKPN